LLLWVSNVVEIVTPTAFDLDGDSLNWPVLWGVRRPEPQQIDTAPRWDSWTSTAGMIGAVGDFFKQAPSVFPQTESQGFGHPPCVDPVPRLLPGIWFRRERIRREVGQIIRSELDGVRIDSTEDVAARDASISEGQGLVTVRTDLTRGYKRLQQRDSVTLDYRGHSLDVAHATT
jgi:hypothetical protein